MNDASENYNTMDEMWKVMQENPSLKEEWEDSIEPAKMMMSSVFESAS